MRPPSDEPVLPLRLCEGDRVRLVSPASPPSEAWLAESIAILEGWGLVVEVGDHAMDRWGYMAGRDEDRLADLDAAFADPGVRAIVTTRGGAGAYRIADAIDVAAVVADPKPVVGFSDITAVHLAVWHRARVPGVHGCLAGARATASVRHLLMSADPLVVEADPTAVSAAVTVPGRAEGPLVGGNLRTVAGAVGARLPDLAGAIVFLEDERKVGLGQVDRQLTQLITSGALGDVAGVVVGLVTGFDGHVDGGWTVVDVLRDRLGSLGVPVLGGIPAGHGGVGADGGPDQVALALGSRAVLDTHAGTLTTGPVVR